MVTKGGLKKWREVGDKARSGFFDRSLLTGRKRNGKAGGKLEDSTGTRPLWAWRLRYTRYPESGARDFGTKCLSLTGCRQWQWQWQE
jgi:hypothetical protein